MSFPTLFLLGVHARSPCTVRARRARAQIQLPATDYQFGRTKLFLRDKPAALLETRLAQIQALRLAKLKAEIERKRKEEEERRLAEEARMEEEKRLKCVCCARPPTRCNKP